MYETIVYMEDGSIASTYTCKTKRIAMARGFNRCYSHHSEDHFDVMLVDTQTSQKTQIARCRLGYDARMAIRDLRGYRNCIRDEIGGWELGKEGFRLLVKKGYITQSDRHLEVEGGVWELTDKFRRVGNYLVKRGWW